MLPPSALRTLSQLEIAYPMLFEITNQTNGRKLHCGVLEFIANEGSVLMPHWMMQNLGVDHGDLIKVESATLPKGTYVKLRPQTKAFIDIANPKAVLENTLRLVMARMLSGRCVRSARLIHRCRSLTRAVWEYRNFSALTRGSTIRIHYNQKQYDIDVVEIKPVNHYWAIEHALALLAITLLAISPRSTHFTAGTAGAGGTPPILLHACSLIL